jgi:hypothetical protein
MYTSIYTFAPHIRSVLFLLIMTIIFFISAIVTFIKHRSDQHAYQEKTFWALACTVSGFISITFWWGYAAEYSYYQRIYDHHTYASIQGIIHPFSQEPQNREVFQVGDVIFRNSPRQLTPVFTDHRQIFQSVKEGAEVRIFYTQAYWRPTEYAILQIDRVNLLP